MTIDASILNDRESCLAADRADELASFRYEFVLPEGVIYLDGNSLGALPKAAPERARQVVEEEWGRDLIGSWNKNHWYSLPQRIGNKITQLIGGIDGACVATDTTSINIFKSLAAALRIQQQDAPERRVIVSERENFPTNLYMVEGLIKFLGEVEGSRYELQLIEDERSLTDMLANRGNEVAAVLLTHVNYRTGQMWHMDRVTREVHDAGALIVWDLCHSAGAVPLNLSASEADFAVGCTYKYLNGGPGSPAFVWGAQRHLDRVEQPLTGWFGHRRPFDMAGSFEPGEGANRFLVGTQPILSMATMEVGIDIALRVDQGLLRQKSLALTSLFIRLVEQQLAGHPLTLVTPREPDKRGSHVSFRHPHGFAVMNALISRGVIGDYREPEVLRFGFAPLYNTFTEVWDAVQQLRDVLENETWREAQFAQRGAVT